MTNENPILILADPKGKAWDFAKRVRYRAESKGGKRFKLGEIKTTVFPNGEIMPEIGVNVRQHDCYFIQDSSLNPQYWLIHSGLTNDALMRSSANSINDVLPNMSYDRQDRMAEKRQPISSKFVARILQQHADSVITSDLHNPAVTGQYDIPFDNLKAYLVMINHLKENYKDKLKNGVLVSPDVGSTKRVESYQKKIDLDAVIIDKRRDSNREVGSMKLIGEVGGKDAIIIDDMIDTGGTNISAAQLLIDNGAKSVISCATHGIFSKNAQKRFEKSGLERVIVSDSIKQKKCDKIDVVSLTDLFADTIYSITHGESVSALYE